MDVVELGLTTIEAVDLSGQPLPIGTPVVVGPRGPAGPPGGVALRKLFSTPAAQWTWTHGLGVRPAVVVTIGTEVVIPDLEYPDDQTVVATFDSPVTGYIDIA